MNMASGLARWKTMWIGLAVVLCSAWFIVATPRQVAAQGEKAAPEKPAAAAADKGDKAVDAAAEKPAEGKKKEKEVEGFLSWVIRCSGFIGLVILILSVYFVSTVGRLFWEMRVEVAAPPEMVLQCESLLEQRDFKGIYNLVKDDDSFFSRLLATGISELPSGLGEGREAMDRVGEAISGEMEKKISMLAVLGTLGPMIGLLGTLKGMIAAFGTIARSAGVSMDASMVAGNISEALLLTFEGVALSVPSIYFYALFRNRVIFISTSVMLTADQFLRHFSHAGRAKASATASTPKPAK